jgi:hypothetical protein
MAKVKNSHGFLDLVGAEGFEPTTSLELNQGALTAELCAYSPPRSQIDGIRRISFGPRIVVQLNGSFFHNATGS